jgi:general stress protein 26
MITTSNDITKLVELIKDIRVAMLVTMGERARGTGGTDGLHVRPMYTQQIDPARFDGDLWFLTSADSRKAREIDADERVLIVYADPASNKYVAIHGVAATDHDPTMARELWNVHAKAWWPGGPDDPNIRVIRVKVESAEYWDGPSNVSYFISLARAVATGTKIRTTAEHGSVTLDGTPPRSHAALRNDGGAPRH